jgi:hypothetical protein
LQPKVGRFKPGIEFNSAKREFRKVAKPILSPEMCETIQSDYLCRAAIADRVASTFHTSKKANVHNFLNSEEFALCSILTQQRITELIPIIA